MRALRFQTLSAAQPLTPAGCSHGRARHVLPLHEGRDDHWLRRAIRGRVPQALVRSQSPAYSPRPMLQTPNGS